MPLVVEDGSGLANADSWASIAVSDAYANGVGNLTWIDGDQEFKEQALRRSANYIMAVYEKKMAGKRTQGIDQSLAYPRTGVVLNDGTVLEDDYIPRILINAQIEGAFREFTAPGSLIPDVTSAARVQKSVAVGPIRVEYQDLKQPSSAGGGTSGNFPLIDAMLAPLLDDQKTGNVAFLLRA